MQTTAHMCCCACLQLTIGGPQTILNNGTSVIHAGDMISWSFFSEHTKNAGKVRGATGAPRRVGIRTRARCLNHGRTTMCLRLVLRTPLHVFSLRRPGRVLRCVLAHRLEHAVGCVRAPVVLTSVCVLCVVQTSARSDGR